MAHIDIIRQRLRAASIFPSIGQVGPTTSLTKFAGRVVEIEDVVDPSKTQK